MDNHGSLFPEPRFAEYRGKRLWQIPPNGQGVAALVALAGLNHLEDRKLCPSITADNITSADSYHSQIEMMRLGFAETQPLVACPQHAPVDCDHLLSKERITRLAEERFDIQKARISGKPESDSCTVSFNVVDAHGNAVSFLNR